MQAGAAAHLLGHMHNEQWCKPVLCRVQATHDPRPALCLSPAGSSRLLLASV